MGAEYAVAVAGKPIQVSVRFWQAPRMCIRIPGCYKKNLPGLIPSEKFAYAANPVVFHPNSLPGLKYPLGIRERVRINMQCGTDQGIGFGYSDPHFRKSRTA